MFLTIISSLVVLELLVAQASATTNYCDQKLCREPYRPHVACDTVRRFYQKCGNDVQEIPMNSKMQNLILHKHNQLRAKIARGELGFPPAKRMATLGWDSELAELAFHNAKKCEFAHDKCRNTYQFKYAGQNIAITEYFGYEFTAENRTEHFIQAWFDEYKDCSPSEIKSYPRNHVGPQIGHFTQVVSDRSTRVGCSLVRWLTPNSYNQKNIHYLLVCNYSMTNIINEPVYVEGRTASACSRPNRKYSGLCDESMNIKSDVYGPSNPKP